jgi:HSP20 family molecular chaperone IbpA
MFGEFRDFGKELNKEFGDKLQGILENIVNAVDSYESPKANLYFHEGSTVVEYALAGYTKESLSVQVKDGYLYVSATEQPAPKYEKVVSTEFSNKPFNAKYRLARKVDKVQASFTDGILKIVLSSDNSSEIKVDVN